MGLNPHIIDFSQVHKVDGDLVGKKAHDLGTLWKLGISLPSGFVITTQFYKEFLRITGIDKEIKKTQTLSHPALSDSVDKLFYPVQKKIMQSHIPQALSSELHRFYRKLSGTFKERPLNVFSSSYDNKSIVFTNVKGDANLILKIKTIWSLSLEEPIAIAVQENIKAEIKGKVFSDNPIINKKLTNSQIDRLIEYCKTIQKYFYFPKEIEYVIIKNQLFITQINPSTGTASDTLPTIAQNRRLQKALLKGVSVNPGIATGPVKVLRNKYSDLEVKKGEIIVLPDLDSSIFRKMKNAKAVIIDSILPNSLDKSLYRKDFHIPTVEGTKNATRMFQNGNVVTVNGVSGEIYSGGLIY